MRIEKFVHSCLRLTSGGDTLLFDPGKFSFIDGRVDPKALAGAGFVVITHAHPDHLDPAALKIILAGGAQVVGNAEVRDKLASEGIAVDLFEEGVRRFGAFELRAIPVPHEPILAKDTPRSPPSSSTTACSTAATPSTTPSSPMPASRRRPCPSWRPT